MKKNIIALIAIITIGFTHITKPWPYKIDKDASRQGIERMEFGMKQLKRIEHLFNDKQKSLYIKLQKLLKEFKTMSKELQNQKVFGETKKRMLEKISLDMQKTLIEISQSFDKTFMIIQ